MLDQPSAITSYQSTLKAYSLFNSQLKALESLVLIVDSLQTICQDLKERIESLEAAKT